MKARKRPIVVDFFIWTGDENQTDDPEWALDALLRGDIRFENQGTPEVKLIVPTLEGDMIANRGDYIIKGNKGEIYPCKPEVFESVYDILEEGEN